MEFNLKKVTTEDRIQLIESTIDESYFNGIVNPMVLEIMFMVNTILVYTNIKISSEQLLDKMALYDYFKDEGIIREFNEVIDIDEINYLRTSLDDWVFAFNQYNRSLAGAIDRLEILSDSLLDRISTALEGVDLNALSEVIPLAEELTVVPREPIE